MEQRLEGLAPVIGRDARVLVLGSFPGAASLAARQYYAHPRNHFWPVLGAILGEPLATLAYRERLRRMRAHRVGVWDTIVACERRGSLDADIRNALQGRDRSRDARRTRVARRVLQWRHCGARRRRMARGGLRDAAPAVDQPGVYPAARRQDLRVAGAGGVALSAATRAAIPSFSGTRHS